MDIRERTELWEKEKLSQYAMLACNSKGRKKQDDVCPVRTCYQRDRDRITHCKAFRRLKHKTQVFLSPEGDHYRTRLTHTLEVSQIARTVARALCLNEDLTEAISLGHDLGHTPFGHAGERALNNISECGFQHYNQSVRVVEKLEKKAMSQSANIEKYEFWGLVAFVGIPLPGTGAWTGALIAALLGIRFRKAFPAIVIGVCLAACIMTIISYGIVGGIFG